MLSLSPKRHANLDEFYNPIAVYKRICPSNPIFMDSIFMRLDWMTLRATTVIMANVKSDQVKQSIDNLEKYGLFTEGKPELFIHKEFDQCGSLLRKIMLEREMNHLLTQLPLTVEKRNNLVVFSRSFCQCGTDRAGVVFTECLLTFGTYSVGLILGSYMFHGLNTLRKL